MNKYFSYRAVLVLPIIILLIPAMAMQFTNEIQWSIFDFIFIGTLLYGALGVYFLVSKKLKTKQQKIALAIATTLGVIYIWAELAVGIFTNLGS